MDFKNKQIILILKNIEVQVQFNKLSLSCILFSFLSLFLNHSLVWAQEVSGEPLKEQKVENNSERTTNMEWEPIVGAATYELELTPLDKENRPLERLKFIEKAPEWKGGLKPGKYKMRIRSRDRRGVPGEWSPSEEFYVKLYKPIPVSPPLGAEIRADQAEEFEVTFQWKKQREASKYILFVEDEAHQFKQQLETPNNELKVKLPVARRYFWSIKGFDRLENESESVEEPLAFTLFGKKLDTPLVTIPETTYVRNVQWKKVAYAEKYKVNLLHRDKQRKWNSVLDQETTDTTLPFEQKWEGGEYKLTVGAVGTLREQSKVHSIIFPVAKGIRTAEAEKISILKKSIDRTEDWYFIASYLITQIQYQSENWDQLSKPKMSGWGGTGRLGLGYFNSQSSYGFLGIVDLSGFVIAQKMYQYPSAEVHGYLRWSSGRLGEIRVSSGFYYKEIPEIVGNRVDDFKVSQIRALGVHAGGEYWYPLTNKLGLQMNGRIYLPMAGSGPNGKKILSTPSLQYGVLGSLKLNKVATGLMGYAYRVDNLKYPTSSETAQGLGQSTNQSSIQGQYLNLYLEWDL